jgi:hypothetical protein
MGLRNAPHVFTEQGIATLSSVLRSQRAVGVNIAIIRTFIKLRQLLATLEELPTDSMNWNGAKANAMAKCTMSSRPSSI